jgi:hypothetical protein
MFVLLTLVVVGCVLGVVVVLVRRRKQKEKVKEIIRHMMERRETLRLVEVEASKSNQIKSLYHLIIRNLYAHVVLSDQCQVLRVGGANSRILELLYAHSKLICS